jgi:2,3-bisphosphoglycerate-independent phosphoglycerate mutase
VATYDLKPEMSAPELADKAIEAIAALSPDFVCLNFANPDMVGHTGVYGAIIKAVETTDHCLQRVCEVAKNKGYDCLIIADHGNADQTLQTDGTPHTAHTMNLVPCILISDSNKFLQNGILADVAPTILDLMGIEKPAEMTGKSLLQ